MTAVRSGRPTEPRTEIPLLRAYRLDRRAHSGPPRSSHGRRPPGRTPPPVPGRRTHHGHRPDPHPLRSRTSSRRALPRPRRGARTSDRAGLPPVGSGLAPGAAFHGVRVEVFRRGRLVDRPGRPLHRPAGTVAAQQMNRAQWASTKGSTTAVSHRASYATHDEDREPSGEQGCSDACAAAADAESAGFLHSDAASCLARHP